MIRRVTLPLREWWRIFLSYAWTCYHCGTVNHTSVLQWTTFKYTLICRSCRYMQSYPDHILPHDPEPPSGQPRRRFP